MVSVGRAMVRPVNVTSQSNPMLGPVLVGGLGYRLDEVDGVPPLERHPTGLPSVDDLLGGGLGSGEVMTMFGPPGVGVTRLAIQMALGAAASSKVLFVNGHLGSRRLVASLRAIGGACGVATAALDGFQIASWIPLPYPGREDDQWIGVEYDVVVIDCLDEMFRPQAWPDPQNALRYGRWLRECAQRSSTALIVTARAAEPEQVGSQGFTAAWRRHPLHDVFDDIADASCRMFLDDNAEIALHLACRGGQLSRRRCLLRHDGSLIHLTNGA